MNCGFVGNSAAYGGGAAVAYNYDRTVATIESCQIVENGATGDGGGVWIQDGANLHIGQTVLCDNTPQNTTGYWVDLGGVTDCNSEPCLFDLNQDDVVDATELGLVLGLWGTSNALVDFNSDGIVNAADLGLLIGAWGPCQ
ncbi:hypothetical protein OAF82_00815 [bacterium]|nr:hypothetical protein [bacterium]